MSDGIGDAPEPGLKQAGAQSGGQGVAIVGTGFVADLYMRSLAAFPGIALRGAFDHVPAHAARFAAHWKVPVTDSFEALLARTRPGDVVLNLTNPHAHHDVSLACLRAGHHVYSEKPLAMEMDAARALHAAAAERGLLLASAPCSVLGEAAQTLWKAVREGRAGTPLLVYAELDDGFVSQAPHAHWKTESGAVWPAADEFRVGCTVEHAGYYLTWLIAMFGPVRSVTAAAAELDRAKMDGLGKDGPGKDGPGKDGRGGGYGPAGAPDVSVAVLVFASGVVARLTCSILARHDHSMTVTGTEGALEIAECWDNDAPVRLRRRRRIRRRLIDGPFTRRLRITGQTHVKAKKFGAASMNFALGPAEMLAAIAERRPCRLSADLALHLNEVTLAIHHAGPDGTAQRMTTTCGPMAPADWALA
jgi:predicted dehydrogenase